MSSALAPSELQNNDLSVCVVFLDNCKNLSTFLLRIQERILLQLLYPVISVQASSLSCSSVLTFICF